MNDVAIVTDRRRPFSPEVQRELQPLLPVFSAAGLRVDTVDWDGDSFDPKAARLFVLRTPWTYHRQRERFIAWARAVPRLLNPADVVEWNSHKRYLASLSPVIETEWLADASTSVREVMQRRGWAEAVLKPTVSAGAFRTRRFSLETAAEAQPLLAEILTECEAMLQPYLPEVERDGERSLLYFNGVFSHAVRRLPPLASGQHGGTALTPGPDELALAEKVLGQVPSSQPLLYARVDMVRDGAGALRVMEIELIEPSFFLDTAPGAAERFVAAVAARL